MEYKINILISTIDQRIQKIESIIQPYQDEIRYIISHQVTKQWDEKTDTIVRMLKERRDVIYTMIREMGVARNRNNTLSYIKSSAICLILDDDVSLCENALDNIMKAFQDNRDAEFISFKILDIDSGEDYKSYPKEKMEHSLRTLTSIGTTEMAFRGNVIGKYGIRFDERFGPGAERYPIGEDFIFAMDLYRRGCRMLFVPIPIVRHPSMSTGRQMNDEIIFGRGAMFARVFGYGAFFINGIFALKQYRKYREHYTIPKYWGLLNRGTLDFLKKEKR